MKLILDNATGYKRTENNVDDWNEAKYLLDSMFERPDGTAVLQYKKGEYLLIGNENGIAFAHYYNVQSSMWCINQGSTEIDGYIEFNIGGTATEIPKRRCITKEESYNVAREFIEIGKIGEIGSWINEYDENK